MDMETISFQGKRAGSEDPARFEFFAQLTGIVEHDALHTGVFRRLDVRREIVDEQAARRREVKFVEQRLIDSGLGLEQVNVRRDQRAGKALAARNVVPVGVLAAGLESR